MNRFVGICKKIWGRLFRDHPYDYIGRILVTVLPFSYTSRYYSEVFVGGRSSWFANSILRGLKRKYYSKSDDEIRKLNRTLLWGGRAGKLYHENKKKQYHDEKKFLEIFSTYKKRLLNHIAELLSKNSDYHTICEIGTSDGMLLDYMAKQFTDIRKFVGVDLNKEQILENQKEYQNTKLEFVHTEITDWIKTQCDDGTIFVAAATLEHFTQRELEELLELIKSSLPGSALAINEPVHPKIHEDQPSTPSGVLAFLHNYTYLFKRFGYHIASEEMIPAGPDQKLAKYDNIIIVATTSPLQ